METEKILIELINVKETYKDVVTDTFKTNIHSMITDVIKKIEEQDAQIKKLEDNKWIPCSERLPSSDGEYKVTIDDGNIYTDSIMYSKNLYEVDKYDFEDYEEAIEKDGFYDYWEDGGFYKKLGVIAWMEEQKPYQPKA